MSKSEKNVRLIDAKSLERKIRRHSLWNSEGVVELIRSMPTVEVKKQEDKSK